MTIYDYLIVGTGLFGSVFAYEATKRGKKCLMIDKRNHVGGNLYCEHIESINIHAYGAHIFHTDDKNIWDYVSQFVRFNNYVNSPMAIYKDEIYNLPFNMNTFCKMWNIKKPQEAKEIIRNQIINYSRAPVNLEEQAISLVGVDIYEKLIKGYTEKQWGRKAVDLPPSIIKRLPVRFVFDNNYFSDRYQGIPIGGYNQLINSLTAGIEKKLNTDFFSDRGLLSRIARKIVYTGSIDQYFDYCFGELEYRSLRFEHQTLAIDNYQGNAVVNYTEKSIPYTRIIEHKHFEFGRQEKTVITYEYPEIWNKGMEAYYPINDEINTNIYKKYKEAADSQENIIFGGRLAEYKYYDMDETVESALKCVESEFE